MLVYVCSNGCIFIMPYHHHSNCFPDIMHISLPSSPPMASVITNDSKSQLKAELAEREEELFKAVDYGQQLLEEKEALVGELEKMKLKCEEAEGVRSILLKIHERRIKKCRYFTLE